MIRLNYTSLLNKSPNLDIFVLDLIPLSLAKSWYVPNQAPASDLLFCDIFVSQKVSLTKISDDVIASDLWFGPPNQKSWQRLCLKACSLG